MENQAPVPNLDEDRSQFIKRCLKNINIIESHVPSKRLDVCQFIYEENLKKNRVSFTMEKDMKRAKTIRKIVNLIQNGIEVHLISNSMDIKKSSRTIQILGVKKKNIHVVDNIDSKVKKIIDLKITSHFDSCEETLARLPNITKKI